MQPPDIALRDAGATLEIEQEGKMITLRRADPKARLAKEFGIWVYQGGQQDDSLP